MPGKLRGEALFDQHFSGHLPIFKREADFWLFRAAQVKVTAGALSSTGTNLILIRTRDWIGSQRLGLKPVFDFVQTLGSKNCSTGFHYWPWDFDKLKKQGAVVE